jgi:hypothetical protein
MSNYHHTTPQIGPLPAPADFTRSQRGLCISGKTRHPSKKAAVSVIHSRNGFAHDGKQLRAYHCGKCNGWHLTKAPYSPRGGEEGTDDE